LRLAVFAATAIGIGALVAGCERPPPEATQKGFRGVAMEEINNPRVLAAKIAAQQAPEVIPPGEPGGQRADQIYENVKVLGDLSETEFTRIMVAMTAWVAPGGVAGSEEGQGCSYCHNLNNMADGSKYTYTTARKMLQMTRTINSKWTDHVGATGVTCYTCHRGQPIPQATWFAGGGRTPNLADKGGWIGWNNGQNQPARSTDRASLPADPFTPLLQYAEVIRVTAPSPWKSDHVQPVQTAERTHALMNHMSAGLGVNCTFCHNSRNFAGWADSPPQRATAWHGIRMVRNLNVDYLAPLNTVYPAAKLGPEGDAAKAFCTTCHQGLAKPLNGAPMLADYPELGAPRR
jgi:photosynthetic reaction center cytochrome c subunit